MIYQFKIKKYMYEKNLRFYYIIMKLVRFLIKFKIRIKIKKMQKNTLNIILEILL